MGSKRLSVVRKSLTRDNMQILLLAAPLLYVLIRDIQKGGFQLETFFETSLLVTFLFLFISQILARTVSNSIGRRIEDDVKLSSDFKRLNKKYCRSDLLRYKTPSIETPGEMTLEVCPIIPLATRCAGDAPYKLEVVDNPDSKYQLPTQIGERSEQLMKAHEFSDVYNNTNIRLSDLDIHRETLTLTTSRTTYFDSLLTNRAMDFPWSAGRSVREVYEPGPFVSDLSRSRLSNHLGFNGFVELSDGNVVFVRRRGNLSVAKGSLSLDPPMGLGVERVP